MAATSGVAATSGGAATVCTEVRSRNGKAIAMCRPFTNMVAGSLGTVDFAEASARYYDPVPVNSTDLGNYMSDLLNRFRPYS